MRRRALRASGLASPATAGRWRPSSCWFTEQLAEHLTKYHISRNGFKDGLQRDDKDYVCALHCVCGDLHLRAYRYTSCETANGATGIGVDSVFTTPCCWPGSQSSQGFREPSLHKGTAARQGRGIAMRIAVHSYSDRGSLLKAGGVPSRPAWEGGPQSVWGRCERMHGSPAHSPGQAVPGPIC